MINASHTECPCRFMHLLLLFLYTGCDPRTYIRVEYKLDSAIYKLSEIKPVLAVADGIVMGGGAGIYSGASM